MNSTDVNSIINNLCDKLGTTASKLIPEMAGYQIAKHSIWLAVSIIFIGVCIGLVIRMLWMRKNAYKMLAIYPSLVKELDEKLMASGIMDDLHAWTRTEWANTLSSVSRVQTVLPWDEEESFYMIGTAILSGFIGMIIFGIALYHLIGWSIAPNASAFMWIISQLGGGQ